MKDQLFIFKIGGNIIDDEKKLERFLSDFSAVRAKKILVHGGGKILDKLAGRLNMPQEMIDGRRITGKETIDLAAMVYAGLLNKKIVAVLQSQQTNAVGLSGADGNSIIAKKRNSTPVDFGFVGDVEKVNAAFISSLLENEIVPVFCSVTHDNSGQLLNTNADALSSALASAFSKQYNVRLDFCFEKKGVLKDPADDASLIPEISPAYYAALRKEKTISNGMIPKLDHAFSALSSGVEKVRIGDAIELLKTINTNENAGTTLIAG